MHARFFLLAFALIFTAPVAHAENSPPHAGFADLVEKLSPAVVNVSTTQKVKSGGVQMFGNLPNTPEMEPFRDFFERFGQMQGKPQQEREVTSLGSGFIVDASGYVITNNHVIEDAEEITVTLPNNDKYTAKIIGRDKKVDLALLKVETKHPLPFVAFGDSDAMRVGDWVIAIGNPYGLGGTVTQGIISARQRSINAGPFDDFLQTDAPINRGNSGGPLFNTNGEVIGINTAIFSPSGGGSVGIGFAIPTALAKPIIAQLKEFGRTHRGWLGVKIQEVSDEMADSLGMDKAKGALILETDPKGPAAIAGLVGGDVVTNFDGKDITEMRFLPRIVAETKIGSTVNITYLRQGKSITAKIKVGEQEDPTDEQGKKGKDDDGSNGPSAQGSSKFLGMELVPLNKQLRGELRLIDSLKGMVVLRVENDSPALKRGLRRGDVIIEANGEPTVSVAALHKIFEAAKKAGRKFVMVKIVREGNGVFVTLPAE
ncbi:MAG: DegQ family serine endoprotease [Alphaproteobacteria bacterium]|nr:DegQ family serine endoprotease [Alphaproteobacteria bacterium]